MPKNLSARNYEHFTFDLVLWETWRFELENRAFKVFKAGPIERTYTVRVGPIAVSWWIKRPLPESFRDAQILDDPLFDDKMSPEGS